MKTYHYTECGLPNVYLRNGFSIEPSDYGETVSIHDADGLHRAIGRRLALVQPTLNGREVRYLRKELDLSQTELAVLLGIGETSVRGWENDRTPIGRAAERLLRILYLEGVGERVGVREVVERLAGRAGESVEQVVELEEGEGGWACAA